MRDSLNSVRDRIIGPAEDSVSTLTTRTSDTASGVGDALRSAPESARAQAEGRPLIAGAVAFGAGFLAAAATAAEEVKGQASTSAQQVKDQPSSPAGRGPTPS